MTWQWEYDPDEQHVAGGAPPAFLAEVEKKADELVRAAVGRATQVSREAYARNAVQAYAGTAKRGLRAPSFESRTWTVRALRCLDSLTL